MSSSGGGGQNFQNRTLFHNDCLDVLRALNSQSIDLIAIDPPFCSGVDWHAKPGTQAEGTTFQDRWQWTDTHTSWLDEIRQSHAPLAEVVEAARYAGGEDMGAFICFLSVRIITMHRVLKDTGSIFLHCDPTANYYIRATLDAVFGRENFRNEIVWCYTGPSAASKQFPRKHDTIFWYSKSSEWTFNDKEVRVPSKWNGLGGFGNDNKEKQEVRKKVQEDWIVRTFGPRSKERVGYPTQKPLFLYRHFIKAASNKGDWVLDCFCGCATTCVAAEQEERKWVGVDIWEGAYEVIVERLENECHKIDGGKVTYTKELPERTDSGEVAVKHLQVPEKFHEPAGKKLSKAKMKELLIRQAGGNICAGCDREFDRPEYLQLDHITPKSQRGIDHISNRMLLCGPCNSRKSDTDTLKALRKKNKEDGFMTD